MQIHYTDNLADGWIENLAVVEKMMLLTVLEFILVTVLSSIWLSLNIPIFYPFYLSLDTTF